ncbi:MAG: hypothetical protein HY343_10890 [Lentisphaerae bacterium]|nr:hypothetical protein [Lentisphaerota bacterium]
MSLDNAKAIEGALQRLGKRLVYDHVEPIALLVCGGSALNVLNIASRTTRDVDVLAVVRERPGSVRLHHSGPLPKAFCRVVMEVGRDLGLPADWLNMGYEDIRRTIPD